MGEAIMPVPQHIDGWPVVGAITVPPRPGERPFVFIVITQQHEGTYVTWRTSTADGIQWAACHPEPHTTWPDAVDSLIRRASLPMNGA
jgi:hypothetical protein